MYYVHICGFASLLEKDCCFDCHVFTLVNPALWSLGLLSSSCLKTPGIVTQAHAAHLHKCVTEFINPRFRVVHQQRHLALHLRQHSRRRGISAPLATPAWATLLLAV